MARIRAALVLSAVLFLSQACSQTRVRKEISRFPADVDSASDFLEVDPSMPDPALGPDDSFTAKIRGQYRFLLASAGALKPCLARKVDPLNIKEVAARTFRNDDWEKYLSGKPDDWKSWHELENKVRVAAEKRLPLTLNLLQEWHQDGVLGKPGVRLLDEVNRYFDPRIKMRREDPIRFALHMQRKAVSHHVFPKDSVWIRDYITFRAGLPPIVTPNRDGALESLAVIDGCLNQFVEFCRDNLDDSSRAPAMLRTLQESRCGFLP